MVRSMIRLFLALFFAPVAWLSQKRQPGVRVLMYHRIADLTEYDQLTVDIATFETQMSQLAQSSKVISLDDALEVLRDGKKLRRPRVVISFDDGYLDNLENALPILERYRLPAIIFITTRFADQTQSHPRYPGANTLHLNWDQLRRLASHPLITLGSHTLSHPYLQSVSADLSRSEIVESAIQLEKQLNQPMKYFCYPSGDYSDRELAILSDSTYHAAVTVAPGVNVPGKFSPFELNRTEVTARDKPMMFRLKLLGAMDLVHKLLHMRRKKQFHQQAAPARTAMTRDEVIESVTNSAAK